MLLVVDIVYVAETIKINNSTYTKYKLYKFHKYNLHKNVLNNT